MKNLMKFLLLLAVMAFTTNSFAQTKFGVRAGVNLANVNIESDGLNISPDGKVGISIAGLAEVSITPTFAVQPEVHFIQKGYKFEFDFLGTSSEQKVAMNYLEIPIHAKYKFGEGNLAGFIMAGPAFGYALSGEAESCSGGDCETVKFEFNDDDGFKRFDAGLSIGGGVNFGNIFVDLRYVIGLSSFTDDSGEDGVKSKNKGLNIGVGIMFGGE